MTSRYEVAEKTLGRRDSKKVGNNTYMVRGDGCIHVRLHQTNVVTYYPDGRIVLNSGGWRTPTTKDRINNWTSARIYQTKYQWYLADGRPFYDGMEVSA